MYNPRGNFPVGNRGLFGASGYQYQTLPYGYEGVQEGSLISKVMGLLAFGFLFAFIGTFVGLAINLSFGGYWIVAIGGFVVLIALNFAINKPGWNLFLLYLFTFLEGLALAPLISLYLAANLGYIVGEAFLLTAITSLALAVYAWTTKRNFSSLGGYLFMGVILLIVASLLNILLFHSSFGVLLISILGVGIFSAYVLYYVQRARYLADTLPNAIGLTVSLFITVLNLFIFILQILTILQGGNRRS